MATGRMSERELLAFQIFLQLLEGFVKKDVVDHEAGVRAKMAFLLADAFDKEMEKQREKPIEDAGPTIEPIKDQ